MKINRILFFLLFKIAFYQPTLYAQIKIEITNGNSLARLGANPHPISNSDKNIALTFYNALTNKDIDSIEFVKNYYFDILKEDTFPTKNFNSLYWISRYICGDSTYIEKELDDPIFEDLFCYFTENDYERLKEYLDVKYSLSKNKSLGVEDKTQKRTFYDDLLMFNAPDRDDWEIASEIMKLLPLKSGNNVIDLGCGLGYYSYKLSKVVGEEGKVFATDIDSNYINHLNNIIKKSGITNIFPLTTAPDDIGISDSVDEVFICSLYHVLYAKMFDDERTALFNSIKKVLKINGYLIIIDNLSANGKELNNCFIDKRLIIAQLAYWGFSYIDYKELSKQRFMLILKHTNEKVKEQILLADEKPHDNSFLIDVDSSNSLIFIYKPNIDDIVLKEIDTNKIKSENREISKYIIENLELQKGQIVADLECGPGYFTYRFSQLVGADGKVYAIDFKDTFIKAINILVKEKNISNIEVIRRGVNYFSIKERADIVFICSFYSKIYGVWAKNDRELYIKSIKENLSSSGKLVIVDKNSVIHDITKDNESFISKKLIEYQLAYYGFELINDVQITPEWYMLTFKIKEN